MTDSALEISPQREELLRHILPQKVLESCHEDFPGAVRLHLIRRTRAVVLVRGEPVSFHLPEAEQGGCTMSAKAARSTLAVQRTHPDLWGLARHTAAEAMLALRNGHKEYVRVKKRKKAAIVHEADVH